MKKRATFYKVPRFLGERKSRLEVELSGGPNVALAPDGCSLCKTAGCSDATRIVNFIKQVANVERQFKRRAWVDIAYARIDNGE